MLQRLVPYVCFPGYLLEKIFYFFQIKSKIHLTIPVFSLFSCSFSDLFLFFLKIIPPQNSQNAPFFPKIMKKCVLEIPATLKTLEIIPSGNSARSSPAGRQPSPYCTGEVVSVGGRRGRAGWQAGGTSPRHETKTHRDGLMNRYTFNKRSAVRENKSIHFILRHWRNFAHGCP